MEGAELERLVRDAEILRLRTEENLTYRQISGRLNGEISHVMVGKILNRLVASTEDSINERRERLIDMQEQLTSKLFKKAHESGLPSDAHAFVKVAESYKKTLGIDTPTFINVGAPRDYRDEWERILSDGRTVDGTIIERS
ncbi:hypothetical protein [Micromonospora aurantiaca (nom. illeg.)]|uniref:hypothetical protein n=1 Tax=Micromonospora aurantiaca (nom. illeg.) TaxID=47850 RepID=UPI0036AA8D2E